MKWYLSFIGKRKLNLVIALAASILVAILGAWLSVIVDQIPVLPAWCGISVFALFGLISVVNFAVLIYIGRNPPDHWIS